jgi:hypothetical protein
VAITGGGGGGGSNHVDPSVLAAAMKAATAAEPSVTLTWFDDIAPAPVIAPPDGATGTHPTLSGHAGTALGDRDEVAIDISTPAGKTVQRLFAPRDADGDWSAQLAELAPGTYEALVSQSDWASNYGRSSVTFVVETSSADPTPTAPIQAKPAVALPATVRIETRQARLVHGTLSVRLKCTGPAGTRCDGRLTLTAKLGRRTDTLASASYRVAAGATGTVRLRARRPLPRRVTVAAGTATRTVTVR